MQVAQAAHHRLVEVGVVLDAQASDPRPSACAAPRRCAARRRAASARSRRRASAWGTRAAQVDVVLVVRVVQHRVEVDLVDLGDGARCRPAPRASISTFLPPCSRNRWPTLNGFRPSPMKSCVSRVTVPWCTRNTPSLPTNGSIITLNTCASTCFAGSGSEWNSSAARAFALGEQRRIALGRDWAAASTKTVEQLGDARAGARRHEADRDQVPFAQRLLERRVQLLRARLRPARGRAPSASSSTSTTWSMSAWCACRDRGEIGVARRD